MKPLSEADAATHAAHLADPARPANALSDHELQGFFFALACSPEPRPPSEWLPMILGDMDLDSQEEISIGHIIVQYNDVTYQTLTGEPRLPPDCRFRDQVLANLEEDAPIAQWARGFQIGHFWLQQVWARYLPQSLEKEFTANLLALSFFSSRQMAVAIASEIKPSEGETEPPSLESVARSMRELYPLALVGYAAIGQSIRLALRVMETEEHLPATSEKIGRNVPCPCGSGKKYKKCCGAP